MKHLSPSPALSGFFLLFLMLFSLGATAARLEVDRNEIAIGEITTVHLKGAPMIAVVDWKASAELEIVESDRKRARVRGLREGSGTVKCEMNLSTHSIDISVRRAAATAVKTTPVPAPQPVFTPPALQPAYTPPATTPPAPPVYTAPSHPAAPPATASPQGRLAGTWQINANGYAGKLELSSNQGMLIGRVWFDAHATWEPLEDLYFDEAIGELSFSRPGANQAYRGRLQGNTLDGMFSQWSGRDYSAAPPSYSWSATRAGAATAKPVAMPAAGLAAAARISEFTWRGMAEDKVGDWGNGRPNGTPDGHLRLTLDLPDRQSVSSISLWSANAAGDKAGGQVWHSKNGSYWMLGVFRAGRQLNASHIASLGEFSGSNVFDLYANSSGWFNPGQTFLLEVETGDGRVLSRMVKVGAIAIAGDINLARGKPASQSSTSQWSRANDAQGAVDGVINGGWGFHTDQQANPWWQVDLGAVYRLSEVRLYNRLDCCSERTRTVQVMLSDDGRSWRTAYRHNGSLFGGKDGKQLRVALSGEAARHVRLQLNETNWFHLDEVEVMGAGEVATGGAALHEGGRGYTAAPPNAPQSGAPGVDDSLKDVVNQLKGLFGR